MTKVVPRSGHGPVQPLIPASRVEILQLTHGTTTGARSPLERPDERAVHVLAEVPGAKVSIIGFVWS